MLTLLKKEIREFFSSLTGYVVIAVFLIINSVIMWVFPGQFNILDSGYANIDSLFIISPWVFLFLVPAITMRMFSEEKKSGTIELLFTRPLSDFNIILAKYFAGVILVLIALLPTLVYYFTVYSLADPVGNIDSGAVWGSYIGLFFLAASYAAIGVFSSSFTQNQIVSFIVGLLLSLFFYIGLDSLSELFFDEAYTIMYLGISEHYRSISRGVLDTRDIIYFISLISVFLFLTKLVLESRKWK